MLTRARALLVGSSIILVTGLMLGTSNAVSTIAPIQSEGVAGYTVGPMSIQNLGANWTIAQYLSPTRLTVLNQIYTGANTLIAAAGLHFTVALGDRCIRHSA